MASDGCQTPAWTGTPFPHLLHRPNPVESYGDHRKAWDQPSSSRRDEAPEATSWSRAGKQDATGVWGGAAPRGYKGTQPQQAVSPSPAATNVPEARNVLLAGGVRMPLLGIATDGADEATISCALASGYTLLDVAPGTEPAAAAAIAAHPAGRASLFIAARLPQASRAPADAPAAATRLAESLGGGRLDLLIVDWPQQVDSPAAGASESLTLDALTLEEGARAVGASEALTLEALTLQEGGSSAPGGSGSPTLAETWASLAPLVGEGRPLRALGLGHCGVADVEALLLPPPTGTLLFSSSGGARAAPGAGVGVRPVVNRVELHPLLAQRKLVGVCLRKGVQSVAALPLAGGAPELLQHPEVLRVAAEAGKTPEQVVLRWNVQRGLPCLVHASSEASALDNATADGVFGWSLTNLQKVALDTLDCGMRTLACPEGHQWPDPELGGAAKARHMLPKESIVAGF